MPEASELPEILTVREVADHLRCSVVTVQRWIQTGQLAAFRLPGNHIRIRRADLPDQLKEASNS